MPKKKYHNMHSLIYAMLYSNLKACFYDSRLMQYLHAVKTSHVRTLLMAKSRPCTELVAQIVAILTSTALCTSLGPRNKRTSAFAMIGGCDGGAQ